MSDEEFAELISDGGADRNSPFMPNWKSVLDHRENAAVIQYIRGLRKRAVKK